MALDGQFIPFEFVLMGPLEEIQISQEPHDLFQFSNFSREAPWTRPGLMNQRDGKTDMYLLLQNKSTQLLTVTKHYQGEIL